MGVNTSCVYTDTFCLIQPPDVAKLAESVTVHQGDVEYTEHRLDHIIQKLGRLPPGEEV